MRKQLESKDEELVNCRAELDVCHARESDLKLQNNQLKQEVRSLKQEIHKLSVLPNTQTDLDAKFISLETKLQSVLKKIKHLRKERKRDVRSDDEPALWNGTSQDDDQKDGDKNGSCNSQESLNTANSKSNANFDKKLDILHSNGHTSIKRVNDEFREVINEIPENVAKCRDWATSVDICELDFVKTDRDENMQPLYSEIVRTTEQPNSEVRIENSYEQRADDKDTTTHSTSTDSHESAFRGVARRRTQRIVLYDVDASENIDSVIHALTDYRDSERRKGNFN